ncbi:20123_t:CDS:2, partial [Racocetra fulgida]
PTQTSIHESTDLGTQVSIEKTLATAQSYIGSHSRCTRPTEDVFNPEDRKIREEIIRMIIQYLSDEGYTASKMTIYDEANVNWHEKEEHVVEVNRLKKAIL